MQGLYFRRHALHKSTLPVQYDPLDQITKAKYDADLRSLIARATVVDHAERPCDEETIKPNPNYGPPPGRTDETHVLYFAQVKNLTNVRKY